MRKIRDDKVHTFEVATSPYPVVTKETSPIADKAVIRGSASLLHHMADYQYRRAQWHRGRLRGLPDVPDCCRQQCAHGQRILLTTPANMKAECVICSSP